MSAENSHLWGDTPEPDPELLERQLTALLDWLKMPSWNQRQAACLIVGVLPPAGSGDGRFFGAWLPGNEVWELRRDSWRKQVRSEILQVEWLMREASVGSDMPPQAWLNFAIKKELAPPWLVFASAHSECRTCLPLSLQEANSSVGMSPMTQREAASLGGKATRDRNPKRKKFFPIVRWLLDMGQTKSRVADMMEVGFGDEAPARSTIYNWAREIEATRPKELESKRQR